MEWKNNKEKIVTFPLPALSSKDSSFSLVGKSRDIEDPSVVFGSGAECKQ
jgi:hypothetical protein